MNPYTSLLYLGIMELKRGDVILQHDTAKGVDSLPETAICGLATVSVTESWIWR